MSQTTYAPKDPVKAGWLFFGIAGLLVYTDLLYTGEKLLVLLVLFAFIPAFYVKQDWQHYTSSQQRLFKFGYVLTAIAAFVLILVSAFGDTLADRKFKWSNLTLYYAIEESHFYEEAYITFGKIGLSGIRSERVFVQNCCGPNLLEYYGHFIPE